MGLPGDAIYRDCVWCGTKSLQMLILAATTKVRNSKGFEREWTWVVCPRCAGVVSLETQPGRSLLLAEVPKHTTDVDVEYLPENVEEYYRNAIIVLNTGVSSAAAVELRRTLEAAVKHKGINVKPLAKAIEKLVNDGWVTKDFKDVLTHVKKIGNVGAHAGEDSISESEVRLAMKFTTQILRNLFEIPAELEKLNSHELETESQAVELSS